ncbi:MAG: hypothetical protein U0414_39540 [Polyangiaceae bacterium]
MAKGRDAALVEGVERRIADEVGAALENGGHVDPKTLGCARALAPRSTAVRHVLAEAARVLVKGARFENELYAVSLRTLADLDDKRLVSLLKVALGTDDAGGLPALSAACFCQDPSIGAALARAAMSPKTQTAFAAEIARVCRGEPAGARMLALATKVKEAHRIGLSMEMLLPLSTACAASTDGREPRALNPQPAAVAALAGALRILRGAERHLGRWLVMAEVAQRAGDGSALDEASERAKSGPASSRGAWSYVVWALDHAPSGPAAGKRPGAGAPCMRPATRATLELVARLSYRPSADKDTAFLFRLARDKEDVAVPMLEALAKSKLDGAPAGAFSAVSLRSALALARCYGCHDAVESIHAAAREAPSDELRAFAGAALWDLGESRAAASTARAVASSASIEASTWAAMIGTANGDGHALVDDCSFRRVHHGWFE